MIRRSKGAFIARTSIHSLYPAQSQPCAVAAIFVSVSRTKMLMRTAITCEHVDEPNEAKKGFIIPKPAAKLLVSPVIFRGKDNFLGHATWFFCSTQVAINNYRLGSFAVRYRRLRRSFPRHRR
ncbi:MAG: hypothetical protein DMF25_08925 [Verrucomicrobia bacterium]|nr:MAG: hypothetical protein DMF25_08925 [Verrucomicrobiota bacterium]